MFRIIFVLDILNGRAVHAIKGERSKYHPVQDSVICTSSIPLDIISALSPKEIYIADLNHLQHLGDNFELIGQISENLVTMVDIGVENMMDIEKCARIADTIILGTETVSLDLIEKAAVRFPGRINVSIDMKNCRVLTTDEKMAVHPLELAEILNGYAIKDIILLDL
ncbi:MAG: phosphoribosylformimino-5-aminoimidazole carboxamide ribotide isomerase, partial [Candidatus Methanoperedens sp.]|nr:phosphoribosylformimino-5-aminoimidazole carboxamide ribotide isomerase [Candidatus Methanoperedens sp.]